MRGGHLRRPADATLDGGKTLLFASGRHESRARRPTDVVLAISCALFIVIVSVLATLGSDVDSAASDVVTQLPPFFDPLWKVLIWASLVWSVVLLAASLVRRRFLLTRDVLAAVALAAVVAVALSAVVTDETWAVLGRLGDLDGPASFPSGSIAVAAAAIAVASPNLIRPFRHLGRWLVAGSVVGGALLGTARPSGAIVAVAVGVLAACVVHLVVGSPGGQPSVERIQLALLELGVEAHDLRLVRARVKGVVRFVGCDDTGDLNITVYGRDAWDAQLMATLWRLAWYRGSTPTARFRRLELVEHEAFMTLLAERAGVGVPHLVTAGSAGHGDALLVVRPVGEPVVPSSTVVGDRALDDLWADLARLQVVGVTQHQIDLGRLVMRDDGSVGFGDLSTTSVGGSPDTDRRDRAQLLAACIALVGEDRAVAAARRNLTEGQLLACLPYLQDAACAAGVRAVLDSRGLDLDEVRGRLRTTLGAADQPLVKLRRVTGGSLLNLALLAIAAYTLIGLFGDLDLESFVDALADAKWSWLVLALVLAQLARLPTAMSTMGSVARPLPFGVLSVLQFAMCYVNLAIPSTAARVAINVRFFQRFGIAPAAAITAGVIDSVSGFVVQAAILVLAYTAADLDLHVSTDLSNTSGFSTLLLVLIVAVVVVGAIVFLAVQRLRNWVLAALQQARSSLGVLRVPTKLLQLFGGNLASQVIFAVALGACVAAFGVEVPLFELLVINTLVSLFAGLLPVPGGIGVSEAGLTLGLTAAGLPTETAFAVALAYRFSSFYLPPIWGWFAYRWLVRRRYL